MKTIINNIVGVVKMVIEEYTVVEIVCVGSLVVVSVYAMALAFRMAIM